MKKTYLLLLLLLSLSYISNAQLHTVKTDFDSMYRNLDPQVFGTTGIFLNRYPSISSITIFDGKTDTAINDYNNWRQQYYEITNSRFDSFDISKDTVPFAPLDLIIDYAREKLLNDTTPIGLLYYKYFLYREEAIDSGYTTYDSVNNVIVHNDTNFAHLYTTKDGLGFTPLVSKLYYNKEYLISFDSNFVFSNIGFNSNAVFRINFDNGAGFQNINFGDVILLSYTDTTINDVTWTLEIIQNGDTLRAKTKSTFIRKSGTYGDGEHSFSFTSSIGWGTTNQCTQWKFQFIKEYRFGSTTPTYKLIKVCTLYEDVPILPKGQVTVKRGIDPITGLRRDPSSCYKKPIIILDGVDFGSKDLGIRGCKNGECGDFGWFDLLHPNVDEYPQMLKMPSLISQLNNLNYDVIFLDNEYGADFMQRNAMLLVSLINKINAEKCDCDEIVVVGPSMGGQVARYALSYMEKNNIPHETRLFIAFDSPNKGANIAIGSQEGAEYFAPAQEGSKWAYENQLGSPAAKQLLIANVHGSGFNPHSYRGSFLSDLASLGTYPKKLRKISMINGSKTGQEVFTPANKQYIDYNYIALVVNIRFNAWGVPGINNYRNKDNVVAHMNRPGAIRKYVSVPSNTANFDNAPGCRGDHLKSLAGRQKYYWKPGQKIWIGVFDLVQKEQTFISSNSALDLISDDLYYNINTNMPNPVPYPSIYPFDGYFAPTDNERHVEVTDDNIAYLINELTGNDTYFSTIPNSNGNTFNFGLPEHKKIPSVTIGNLGKVQANGNYATNYGAGGTPDPGSTLDVYASTCEPVIIESGGQLVAGDNNGTSNNKAIIRFGYGSVLDIRNGGKLTVYNGSTVIIEEGAKLIYNPGAQIVLDGENAVLEIRGRLEIKAGASFTFSSSGGVTNGFVRFDLSDYTSEGIVVTGTTANFGLSGANIQGLYQDKVLEIIGGELKTPDNSLGVTAYLNSFTIYNGMVNLKDGGKLSPTVTSTFTYTYFNGEGASSSEYGLDITKPSLTTINHCSFKNLNYGLRLDLTGYLSAFPISYSSFSNNNTGIYSYGGGGLDISNSTFNSNVIGVKAITVAQDCKFLDCHFSNNSSEGIELNGLTTTNSYFYHSSFTSNYLGINTLTASPSYNNVNVTLKCSKFKNNNIGVQAGHDLNLSTTKTLGGYSGGDNVFYFNSSAPSYSTALYPTYSLYLGSSQNSFIDVNSPTTTNTFIVGEARVCSPTICDFYNTTNSLKGSGSYWNPAPSANNLNNGNGSLYILNKIGGGTLLLDGSIATSFTSSCFNIPSGTEPQFVSSGTGPFNKTGDTEIEQEEINNPVKLSVYPNPAKDRIYIQTPLKEQKTYTLQLFDLVGRKVYENVITSSEYSKLEIPTTTLANGNYLLTIKTSDGSLFESQRVVILNQ